MERTNNQITSVKNRKRYRRALASIISFCICTVLLASCNTYNSSERKMAKESLYNAIENEDQQTVIAILDRYPNLLNENYYRVLVPIDAANSFPLYAAIKSGNLDMVKLLVERGANVNHSAPYCNLPLHKSLDRGDYEIAWYLIENGADISAKNGSWNETVPFCILAQKIEPEDIEKERAQFELLKYALEHGAPLDPPVGSNEGIKSLLGLAVYNNNTLAAKYLIDEQIYEIDEIVNPEYTKQTALIVAVRRQSYECCQLLLDYGADKTITDIGGKTAIDYAIELNDEKLIAMLNK